jgi:hypothetical protein
MAIIPVENVGEVGIVKDINPWQLPSNVWSDGNNVRSEHGSIVKSPGYSEVMATVPVAPYYVTHLVTGVNEYWIVGGLTAIHAYDDSSVSDTLDGGISDADTTITVDSTVGFESNGTITIGSEDIPYTGKSATQFTGCSRGGSATAHLDGVAVSRTNKWYDLTRGPGDGGAYSATATENWTATVIGGVLIMTNGFDEPQYWELISGVPATIQKMQNLNNFTASTECKSMRAFRSFLVALNITTSGINYPRVVKWSTEAGIQTTPTSWDVSSATVDAGEYELADSKGEILDGLPLRDTFMIYKEDSIYSMSYVGTPFIFQFNQLSPSVGALSKNCVAEYEGGHFFLGNGDVYINDGQRIQSILPHKIRDYIFGEIDGANFKKSFVVADYGNTEMWACFPTPTSATNQCNKAVVWNWTNKAFTIRDLPDLAGAGYGTIPDPNSFTTWAAAIPTWSSALGTWTETWSQSENIIVMASPTDTKLYRNASGNREDDTDMISFIERTGMSMNAQQQNDQSTVKRIKAVWPKMEVTGSGNTVNVYVGTQNSTEEAVTWSSAIAFNPDTQSKVSVRKSGKLYGIKFESTGDFDWRLDGYEFELDDAGRRGSRSY